MPKGKEIRVTQPPLTKRLSPAELAARQTILPNGEPAKRVIGVIPSFIPDLDKTYNRPIRPGALDYRKISSLIAGVRVLPGETMRDFPVSPAIRYGDSKKGAGLGYYPSKKVIKAKAQEKEAREGVTQ